MFRTLIPGLILAGAVSTASPAPLCAQVELVKDINTAPASSTPRDPVLLGDYLYFSAMTPDTGRELVRTDGTSKGTELFAEVAPGPTDSSPEGMVELDGTIYFSAHQPDTGLELWKSDGSEEGTVLVADIYEGPLGSSPHDLTVFGDALVFCDVSPGARGSDPSGFFEIDGTLYFVASDAIVGRELRRLEEDRSFLRGDFNGDGEVSGIVDALAMLRWGFGSEDGSSCDDAADINDDGVVSALPDRLYLLRAFFQSGEMPPAPGIEDCGGDPTLDALECTEYTCP